ncbi:acetyl-CoA synthetase-like protein [Linderina pennispora]|uniref:Acetyl-CoA synthetase-like protein n=1 Tax=Linderina pennispora TaxID=61395 RepID=A0A1Y1VW40_9FUNG|nr:acetyl-CoA synthetase-like protein [Linderina pennispora]ORX65518.1 acetyl-CoA synthetase-like protein [Linderina pennispora]
MAVNPQQSVQALAHQLKDVDARVVFTTAHLLPVLQQVCDAAGLDIPTSNIVLIQGCSDGFTTLETAIDGAAAIESHRVTSPEELNRVALIVYSSGTTGKAKGIMLTHRNIVSMYVMVGRILCAQPRTWRQRLCCQCSTTELMFCQPCRCTSCMAIVCCATNR